MEIIVNGHRLYYEMYGPEKAQPVVLLHHGLGSTRSWKKQIPDLVRAGYQVVAFDRWGYGASEPRSNLDIPYFSEDIEDLLSLLDLLKINQAHLVGHSDGGTIALYFAAQNPERINRLVVVAAHIYVEDKMDNGIKTVRSIFENDESFRRGLRRIHGDKAERVFQNWYEGWYAERNLEWDMRSILRNIQAPVLVVQGSEDEYATPQHAEDLSEALPNGKLWLEHGGTHMLPQERAEIFNAQLIAFLEA